MSNESGNVRRCDQVHDAKQNKEHSTTAKYSGVSRCRHKQRQLWRPSVTRNALGVYLKLVRAKNETARPKSWSERSNESRRRPASFTCRECSVRIGIYRQESAYQCLIQLDGAASAASRISCDRVARLTMR
jgi:hypothetical protein